MIQPPTHYIGRPAADLIIFAVAAVVCLYWLRALILARQGAKLFFLDFAIAILIFFGIVGAFDMMRTRTHTQPMQEHFVAAMVAFFFLFRHGGRKRPRTIPKAVRKAVIERDLKGEKFDPEKHHLDHVWPFSKGGSHTVDNLRVLEKTKNLRKGAKKPRLRDMW